MNTNLSLTNNEGYTFTFLRENDRCSIRITDKFGDNLGQAVHVFLGDLTPSKLRSIEKSPKRVRERLITEAVQERFVRLAKEVAPTERKRTFKVQFHKQRGNSTVVFSKYGLSGGGWKKTAAFAAGGLKAASGVYIVSLVATAALPPALLCTGTALLAAGANSIYYAVKTKEEKINKTDFMKNSVMGLSAGALVGAPLTTTVPKLTASACIGATVNILDSLNEAVLKQDDRFWNRLTGANIMRSAGLGVLTAGVTDIFGQAISNLVGQTGNDLAQMAIRTLTGSVAGVTCCGAVKLTENMMKMANFVKVMYSYEPVPYEMQTNLLYLFYQAHELGDSMRYKIMLDEWCSREVHIYSVKPSFTAYGRNCFFRAVASQLKEKSLSDWDLRRMTAEQLEKCWSQYGIVTDKDPKVYSALMSQIGEGEIRALADVLQMRFQVRTAYTEPFFSYGDETHPEMYLTLLKNSCAVMPNGDNSMEGSILKVLQSNGNAQLNEEQYAFILGFAAKEKFLPLNDVTQGLKEEISPGALLGAAIGTLV